MRDPDPLEDALLLGASLEAAAVNCGPGAPPQTVIGRTWEFFRAITRPTVNLAATVTISRNGKVSAFYQFNSPPEEPLMTAMTMDDTADIVIAETDDHGDPTSDALTWTGSDGGTVLTLTPSADTLSCHVVPVAEGTGVTVTAADPTAPAAQPFVASFDVGPGPTSSITGTVTVNTGANVVPPAG
jgi:hypothetical protein